MIDILKTFDYFYNIEKDNMLDPGLLGGVLDMDNKAKCDLLNIKIQRLRRINPLAWHIKERRGAVRVKFPSQGVLNYWSRRNLYSE